MYALQKSKCSNSTPLRTQCGVFIAAHSGTDVPDVPDVFDVLATDGGDLRAGLRSRPGHFQLRVSTAGATRHTAVVAENEVQTHRTI